MSASWNLSDRLKLILEAQNLTDEQNRLFIDSVREDTLFELRNGRTITFGVNYQYETLQKTVGKAASHGAAFLFSEAY